MTERAEHVDPARAPRSRRQILKGAGLLAAAGATTLLRAERADAANGNAIIIGANGNAGTAPTGLAVLAGSSPAYGFGVTDNGLSSLQGYGRPTVLAHAESANFDSALLALATGQARGVVVAVDDATGVLVHNNSSQAAADFENVGSGDGVFAFAGGGGAAVYARGADTSTALHVYAIDIGGGTAPAVVIEQSGGADGLDLTMYNAQQAGTGVSISNHGVGNALAMYNLNAGATSSVVLVQSASTGTSVTVNATHATTTSAAVNVFTSGLGCAIVGTIGNAGSVAPALKGVASKGQGVQGISSSGVGVDGLSSSGPGVRGNGKIGGAFTGTAAQVRLNAAGAGTHPASGTRGDLFVDNTGRLWFCKGGVTWKQLA